MRKFFGLFTAVTLLTVALLVASPGSGSVFNPKVVGACSVYGHESWGTSGRNSFFSTYTMTTDYLNVNIETLKNDCGYRLYRYGMWTDHGTPLNYELRGRIWVCGTLKYNILTYNSNLDVNGVGPYGGCARQADSWYNTYANASGFYNANGTTYVYAQA